MGKITEKEMEEVRKMVKAEFPDDPALQQVHIARKIIAKEVELEGLSFLEYVKHLESELGLSIKGTAYNRALIPPSPPIRRTTSCQPKH